MVNRVSKAGRWTGAIKSGAQTLIGKKLIGDVNSQMRSQVQSYAKGGVIKKTGLIRAHKGEIVINASTARALKGLMKR
jgi:hypothetical protein